MRRRSGGTPRSARAGFGGQEVGGLQLRDLAAEAVRPAVGEAEVGGVAVGVRDDEGGVEAQGGLEDGAGGEVGLDAAQDEGAAEGGVEELEELVEAAGGEGVDEEEVGLEGAEGVPDEVAREASVFEHVHAGLADDGLAGELEGGEAGVEEDAGGLGGGEEEDLGGLAFEEGDVASEPARDGEEAGDVAHPGAVDGVADDAAELAHQEMSESHCSASRALWVRASAASSKAEEEVVKPSRSQGSCQRWWSQCGCLWWKVRTR
jgi:hypothetical protein